MGIINHLLENPEVEEEEVSNFDLILREAGVGTKASSKEVNPKNIESIREVFSNAGAGIKEAAEVIGTRMQSSREDISLKASEMALKVQGIFKDMDGDKAPVINIQIAGNDNSVLVNFVTPNV